MKILIVSEDVPHPSMGGLGKHAVTLARALASVGHKVDFMGSRRFPYDEAAQAEFALPGEFYADLWWRFGSWKEPTLGFFNPLRRAVLARDFARIIMLRARHYDVVHYHGHVPDLAAFIPSDVNFVQTRHDQGSDCLTHMRFRTGDVCTEILPQECARCIGHKSGGVRSAISAIAVRQYRERVKRAFRAHKTIFVSDMLRRNLSRTAGREPWGAVIHNFLDDSVLRRVPVSTAIADQERARIELLVAGKLYAPKGIEPLLAALQGRLPGNMRLRIVGDGPDEERLRAIYSSERVEFLGWLGHHDTLRLMTESNSVIVPSTWEEPCGTTILEGMALGKPVYALDRGGTPELRRYERKPGQLRLFPRMDELASAVLNIQRSVPIDMSKPFSGAVGFRLHELLKVYSMDRLEFTRCALSGRLEAE